MLLTPWNPPSPELPHSAPGTGLVGIGGVLSLALALGAATGAGFASCRTVWPCGLPTPLQTSHQQLGRLG